MYKIFPILLFGLVFSVDNVQDSIKFEDGIETLFSDKIKLNDMVEDIIFSNISQILNLELFILDIEFNHTCDSCDDTLHVKRLTSILNIFRKNFVSLDV